MSRRFRLEQHAVAILLAFSGVCFGAGLVLQQIARAACPCDSTGGAR